MWSRSVIPLRKLDMKIPDVHSAPRYYTTTRHVPLPSREHRDAKS